MTYNPDTGRIRCGVCGSRGLDRSYYTYTRIRKKRITHICSICIDNGAYWCPACEDVHAGRDECPQSELPLNV